MKTRLERNYRFEAAHFLPKVPAGHKCSRMHGHSYAIELVIEGDIDPERGWVMDFAEIDEHANPLIRALDHQVLNEVPGLTNPTSELLAVYVWQKLHPTLPGLVEVCGLGDAYVSLCLSRAVGVDRNVRVVTLNFWQREAPLHRRLELAIHQLETLAPDVVCLQEVWPYEGRTTAHVIADALGLQAHYAPSVTWDGGEEGLAILAKEIGTTTSLPLPEPRIKDARQLLSALVNTVGGPIWVHTTHLHYRLDDGLAREAQVLAIDDAIRQRRTDTSPPQILCGDMNATPDSDEMRFLRGLTTLGDRRTHFQDAWLRLHDEPRRGGGPAEGITWSSENELTRPLRSLDIDRRLDYIYVTSRKRDGRGTVHRCEVVLTERSMPGDICASDHYGVLADIQVVANPA